MTFTKILVLAISMLVLFGSLCLAQGIGVIRNGMGCGSVASPASCTARGTCKFLEEYYEHIDYSVYKNVWYSMSTFPYSCPLGVTNHAVQMPDPTGGYDFTGTRRMFNLYNGGSKTVMAYNGRMACIDEMPHTTVVVGFSPTNCF